MFKNVKPNGVAIRMVCLSPVKKTNLKNGFLLLRFLIPFLLFLATSLTPATAQTAVERYGQLRVSGNRIVDKNGAAVQLRGMSLYWSQWIGKYYNVNTIRWLRDDWKITVIRAAMGINGNTDGYLVNPTAERNKVIAAVDAAIQLGIYVIIDWHDHNAHNSRAQAQAFFSDMAARYGNTPNVIYETWNEPLNYSWADIIKPYHQAVISSIRARDPDNIIICGTRNWSQEVDEAASNPIAGGNIAYTLHYYANTHGQWLRDRAALALSKGVALFVTEYGTTDATGNGVVNATASREWWAFLDQNKIGHANWSVADISESSAALTANASVNGGWSTSQIKQSGNLVRDELRAKAIDVNPPPPPPPGNTPPTVSITSPANNAGFAAPASITITATAADANGTVSNVQFFNGTTLLGSDASAPYSVNWSNIPVGTYSITARATDNAGAMTTSSAVSISITTGTPPPPPPPPPTGSGDIIGADCGANNTSITYELNATRRTNVTSYTWWYTGSAASTTIVSGIPYRAVVQTGVNFSAGQICVGVNLSVSPWYTSYCKAISKCATVARVAGTSSVTVSPNPTQGAFTLTASEDVASYSVSNAAGNVLLQGRTLAKGARLQLGSQLSAGNYVVTILFKNGKMETKNLQKLQ